MRKWIIALAALMVLPAVGAAATIVTTPVTEQLVEGHTVFTVIEVRRQTDTAAESFAAAVAVLVRDVEQEVAASRFPGVLWFNDQYLVNPESATQRNANIRYPCTGAVLAVDASSPDPRPVFATPVAGAVYVESYLITDPNDHAWDVDKWNATDGIGGFYFIWTVPMKNSAAGRNITDDGVSSCAPWADSTKGGPILLPFSDEDGIAPRSRNLGVGPDNKDPGENLLGYPCGGAVVGNCPDLQYNAVLYFRLEDLKLADRGAPKDHDDETSTPGTSPDVSGCHATYAYDPSYTPTVREWPCPATDDNAEGNSHSYNPETPYPSLVYDGRGNHGGSTTGCGNPRPTGYFVGEYECHATQNIQIYFDRAHNVVARNYWLVDVEGSTAPYHCHDDMATCDFGDFVANTP